MGQIGDILKEARERKGKTLSQAEEETKIRVKYLEALENETFQEIPGQVYVKGFLNNYASYLGLDAQEIVRLYKETVTVREEEVIPLKQQKPVVESKKYKKRYKFNPNKLFRYALGVVAIITLLAINSWWHNSNTPVNKNSNKVATKVEQKKNVAQKNKDNKTNNTPANKDNQKKEEPKTDTQQQQAQQNQTGVHLILKADQGLSWARIIVDGNVAFEGNINQGEAKNFDGKDKIAIRIGNAGVVNVTYNGNNQGYLGAIGSVVDKEFAPATTPATNN